MRIGASSGLTILVKEKEPHLVSVCLWTRGSCRIMGADKFYAAATTSSSTVQESLEYLRMKTDKIVNILYPITVLSHMLNQAICSMVLRYRGMICLAMKLNHFQTLE